MLVDIYGLDLKLRIYFLLTRNYTMVEENKSSDNGQSFRWRLLYVGLEKRSKLCLCFQIVTQIYVDFLLRIKRGSSSAANSVQLAS